MERGKRRRGGRDEGRESGRGRRDGGGRGGRGGRGGGRIGWENEQEGMAAIKSKLDGLYMTAKPRKYDEEKLVAKPDNGGKAGRPIPLYANHFLMKCNQQQSFQYDVEITEADQRPLGEGDTAPTGPQSLPSRLSRKIVQQCSDENNWGPDWVYDGKKTLYTPEEYPVFTRQRKTFPVQVQISNRTKKFNVHVQWAATINFLDLYRYLQEGGPRYPQEAIMNLEVLLRHGATRDPNCFVSGRSIYFNDQNTNRDLPGSSELWLGYHQSVKPCHQGLCLNIDTTCTAFLKSGPVVDFLMSAGQLRSPADLARLSDRQYRLLNQSIASLMVETTHRGARNKKEKVKKLTRESAEKLTFKDRENRTKSVANYWREAYGNLRNPNFPCLDVSKSRTKINYLPLEVCIIVAGQRQLKLTDEQTRHVITFSAAKPHERKDNIIRTLNKANLPNDRAVRAYKINIDNRMINVDGRVLPGPHLEYKTPKCMNTGDRGAWNLENVVFYKGAQVRSWAVIDLTGRNMASIQNEQGLLPFIDALIKMSSQMGMILPKEFPPHLSGSVHNTEVLLDQSIRESKNVYNQNKPDIVLVVLPSTDSMNYQEVKRIAEGTLGIVTQCVVARNAGIGSPSRGRPQYLANLAMKINHKVGGVNTQVMTTMARCFPLLGQGKNRPFIVFGADVTHPMSMNSIEQSVGALVASMDPALGQFAARIINLKKRTEQLQLKDAIKELLRTFLSKNKVKPEAIFYYRDGLSEGEFIPNMKHEYEEFHRAFEELENGYKPPITFVVAQKRHHTRFFPANPKDGDRNGNIHPGTVIDSGITSKFDFDFYLNSHAGIQGTNKPAHYYVLIDENGFGSDGMQMFTYWMCYLYCRCTRSVSYAPPAYYAHLAALHGKYLIDRSETSSTSGEGETSSLGKVSSDLNHKMYFV